MMNVRKEVLLCMMEKIGKRIRFVDGKQLNGEWNATVIIDDELEKLLDKEANFEATDVSDEVLKSIEYEVGMGCGAWDCVEAKEIIAAAWNAAGKCNK